MHMHDAAETALWTIADHLDIRTPEQALALADVLLGITPDTAELIGRTLLEYAEAADAERQIQDQNRIWGTTYSTVP